MKKIIALLLSLTFIFSLSSCASNSNPNVDETTTQALSKEEQNLEKFFDDIGVYKESDSDVVLCSTGSLAKTETEDFLEHVVDYDPVNKPYFGLNTGFVITDDGSLYHVTLCLSGELKHEKVKSKVKFVRFFGGFMIGEDSKLYYYDENKLKIFPFSLSYDPYYENSKIWRTLEKEKDYKKVFCIGYDDFCKVEGNSLYRVKNGKLLYTFPDDEKIEYICDYTIKTNKGIYEIHGKAATLHKLPFEFDFIKFTGGIKNGTEFYIAIVDDYMFEAQLA